MRCPGSGGSSTAGESVPRGARRDYEDARPVLRINVVMHLMWWVPSKRLIHLYIG